MTTKSGRNKNKLSCGLPKIAFALTMVGCVIAASLTIVNQPKMAYALNLPTWDDVQQAKSNEANAAAKVTEIERLIVALEQESVALQAEAQRKLLIYEEAEQKFVEADQRYQSLVDEADKSKKIATEASTNAAALAAQMYRSSGSDQALGLFLDQNATNADELLSKLSIMTKTTEQNKTLYAKAEQASNNARSLGDEAETAKIERQKLYDEAEQMMQAAAEAAQIARDKVAEQEEQSEVLQTQLAALKDATIQTVAGYQERLVQEAAARKAREEQEARDRAAAAAAQAAQRPQNGGGSSGGGGGGGSGGGGGGSAVISGDWSRPSNGRWSSGFGYRDLCYDSCFHSGTDIASAQGTPIFAASSGKVVFSGWSTGYGNRVDIDHGNGIRTRYGHIMNGGLHVSVGQQVSAGTVIARTGSTGFSTGPHVHFEVIVNGRQIDPEPFMRARGISLR